jgi:hypothetical protein
MCRKKTTPVSATNRPDNSVKLNCVVSWPFNACPFNIQCHKMSMYRASAEYQSRMSSRKELLLPPEWDSLFRKHHFYWNKQNDWQTSYGFTVLRGFCLFIFGGTRIELRASCVLSRHHTTWTTQPAPLHWWFLRQGLALCPDWPGQDALICALQCS